MSRQKLSKKQVRELAEKNLNVVLAAIENGAKTVILTSWNQIEYGVQYPQGGYFRITKTIYDKINKNN